MRQLLRRVSYLVRRRTHDADLAEELRVHREMKIRELEDAGAAAREAGFEARRALGSTALAHDRAHDVWVPRALQGLGQDLRFGVRLLTRSKAFALAALLTLGLGIGVNTAIFSVVYGVLLRPLPYPDASRLVRISEFHPGAAAPLRDAALSNLTYNAWRQAPPRTLEGIAVYSERVYTVTGAGEAARVQGADVSPSVFSVLDVYPIAGRFFEGDETTAGSNHVAVISYDYWQEHFGGRREAVGATLILDDERHTIVGVTPLGFSFPGPGRDIFTPTAPAAPSATDAPGPARHISIWDAIGRLAPGITADQASAEGTSIARGLGPEPMADLVFGKGGPDIVRVRSLLDETTSTVRPMLWLLAAGVVLILLIGCANVANLLLSRGVARERELAVRAALGAGHGRLLRQLITESLVLSIGGIAIGALLACVVVRAWPAVVPSDFPRLANVRLDGPTLLFAAALALAAGLLASITPALHAARIDFGSVLHYGTGVLTSVRRERLRRVLLAAEAALAVVLLVGSVLLVRSFVQLAGTDNGYDADHVLTARLTLPPGPSSGAHWQQLASAVLDRVHGLPGVEAAGATSSPPLGDVANLYGFRPAGNGNGSSVQRALGAVVTPGYAEAIRLRLRRGRLLLPEDVGSKAPAAMVNQAFVRAYLNDGRPVLGRTFAAKPPLHIVGVVANVLEHGPASVPQPEFYIAAGSETPVANSHHEVDIVIRTTDDPARLAAALRQIVRQVAPGIPIDHVRLLASDLSAAVAQPRFATLTLAAFAALALGLAAIGLYGVLSYSVSRRRRELAVRTALGATRRELMGLVVRDGMAVTLAGLIVGLVAAAALTRVMQSLLFGVTPLDRVSFVSASLILMLVALAACLLPAWRASRIDPAVALREE